MKPVTARIAEIVFKLSAVTRTTRTPDLGRRKFAKRLGWRRKIVDGRWVDLCLEHADEGAAAS